MRSPSSPGLPGLAGLAGLTAQLRGLAAHAARGKRRSAGVAGFLLDAEASCQRLAYELASRTYQPRAGRCFWICDPKHRCIYALPFRDRVVQHWLIRATLPAIEQRMAAQSFACRVGKGTHRALAMAAAYHRRYRHVLHVDVQKFFASIDHALLRRQLDRVVPEPWRWLRDRFLDAPMRVERADFYFAGDDLFTPQERRHGLPIGSLTSQIWANYYLAPLDDLLRSHLGLVHFVRYCDDLLVYSDDAGQLRAALAALDARAGALRLRLHPEKTRLHRTSDPLPFLGFVLRREGDGLRIRLRRENLIRMRRRLAVMRALFSVGAIGPDEVRSRLNAWLAHARHGHTRGLLHREVARWTFRLREDSE